MRTVLGNATDPLLPEGLDAVLIVNAYHEMDDPAKPEVILTLLGNIARSLKPQGRLGVVDFLPGSGGPGPAAEDRVNPETVIKSAEAAGLFLQSREVIPPFQFILVFGKVRAAAPSAVTDHAHHAPVPTALTIAGSDSGGGAGIQADLKTFAALGVYGTSAITAITAQNTVGVTAVEPLPADLVVAQIEAVAGDITLHATKTGMLANAAIVEAVAAAIEELELPNVVVDPVMVAKSGDRLLDDDAVQTLRVELLPLALVVTPNIPEAEVLSGRRIVSLEDAREAARAIHALGARAVIVKGGHAAGDDSSICCSTASGSPSSGPRASRRATPTAPAARLPPRSPLASRPDGRCRRRRAGAGLRGRRDSARACHRSRARSAGPFLAIPFRYAPSCGPAILNP